MKYLTLIIVFFTLCCSAQPLPFDKHFVDSVTRLLPTMKDDTSKVKNLVLLSQMHIAQGNGNLVLQYAHEADSISKKIQYNLGRIEALGQMAFYHAITGDWPQSIMEINEAFPLTKNENTSWSIYLLNLKFINYGAKNDFKAARMWALRALHHPIFQKLDDMAKWPTYMQLGLSYEWDNQLDSAQYYANILKEYIKKYQHHDLQGNTYQLLGNIARKKKQYDEAMYYYRLGEPNLLGIAWVYDEQNKADSTIHYSKLALQAAQLKYDPRVIIDASQILARRYAETDPLQSNKYLQLYVNTKDTLFNANKLKELEEIRLNEQRQRFEQIGQEKAFRSKMIQYSLMGLAALFLISALFFFRNNQTKKVANEQLEKKNTELRATQIQLEHKNRDLEIESALEKIRTASLAMQHSGELKNVVTVLFEKLKELNLVFDAAAIHVFKEGSKDASIWVASPEQLSTATEINLPYDALDFENNPIILDVWKAKETGEHIFNKIYAFEEKNRYFNYVFKHNSFEKVPPFVRDIILNAECYTATFVSEKNSLLGVNSWTRQLFSEIDFEILKRVARVFEQAYVRFLDLQKAEVQAREAQIEAALEKIRSRSLAMHQSGELKDVIAVMSEKLRELNVLIDSVSIQLFDEKTRSSFFWLGNDLHDNPRMIHLPYDEVIFNEDTYLKDSWQAKKTGESLINKRYSFEQKNKYFEYVFRKNDLTVIPQPIRDFIMQAQNHTTCLFIEKNSALFADSWSGQVYSEDMIKVLKRTAIVFEQAYVRFLDLQKAEAQARESEIELALERVRAKTMSMQKSSELREIVATMYEQLRQVGFTAGACSIVIMDKLTGDTEWWIHGFGTPYPESYWNTYFEHPFYLAQLNHWKEGKKYAVMVCEGEDKKAYDDYVFNKTDFARIPIDTQNVMKSFEKITFSNAYMKYGALSWSTEPLDEAHVNILQRFAYVFEQSYTRFLDLQKAEAQAREAKIEVALERVRARAMAMQKSDELADAARILYHEFGKLSIKTLSCGYMFIDENKQNQTAWVTLPDGTILPNFIDFPLTGDHVLDKRYESWKAKKPLHVHNIQGEVNKEHHRFLAQHVPESVTNDIFAHLPDSITFYSANFSSGYLLILTPLFFSPDEEQIIIRFAKVFELTYTRFTDLKQAEAQAEQARLDLIQIQTEKKRAEDALSELRITQNQLVQKEKLASLGELTAGIAHEIQNPLNFVNNFSELSVSIAQDLKEEMNKSDADKDYIEELLMDLTQNQEKINHHGKRASSIVKGMLEHSRTSTGERVLTDINVLCDEYLRLSYHGMRAKDSSFNSNFKTDFQENLSKVNVIPQDIGRVLLNLINNAFYAVNEKAKQKRVENFTPSVLVSTKQLENAIEIRVRDNGNGIPESVKAKIFQPFFTTKPTGEGTGLGLSLSYDIVTKGHGGTLEVASSGADGTVFLISLPM